MSSMWKLFHPEGLAVEYPPGFSDWLRGSPWCFVKPHLTEARGDESASPEGFPVGGPPPHEWCQYVSIS